MMLLLLGQKLRNSGGANNPEKAANWESKKGEMKEKLQKVMTTVDAVIANPETPADLKTKLEEFKTHLKEKQAAIASGNWEEVAKKMRENRQERIQKMKDLRNSVENAKKKEGISEGLKKDLKELDKALKGMQKKMEKRGERMEKRGKKLEKRGERMKQRGEQMQRQGRY
jgi:chromosome segregation ATPase